MENETLRGSSAGSGPLSEPLIDPNENVVQSNTTLGRIEGADALLAPESPADGEIRDRSTDDDDDDNDKVKPSAAAAALKGAKTASAAASDIVFDVIVPTGEPIPIPRFLLLFLLCAAPAVAYNAVFTQMGIGLKTYSYVNEHHENQAWMVGMALVAFVFGLYVLDAETWDTRVGKLSRRASYVVVLLLSSILVLFVAGDYPYGPICMFTVLTPVYVVMVKVVIYPRVEPRRYITWLGRPLLAVSLASTLAWTIWTFVSEANEWNEATRIADAEGAACEPDFTDHPNCAGIYPAGAGDTGVCFYATASASEVHFDSGCDSNCTEVYDGCLNTFITWVGPFLVGVAYFFLSFFTSFLRVPEGSNQKSTEGAVLNFAKVWLFLLFALWVTAQLLGAGSGLTSALGFLTLASFVASAVFLSASFTRDDQKAYEREAWKRLDENFGTYYDIARGLLVLLLSPVALVYVVFSFFNQCVRRLRFFPCSRRMPEESEKLDWITKRTRSQIETFQSWDRTVVYTYAVYWGLAIVAIQVLVAQFTLLFLSWIIEATADMSLGVVSAIMLGVGLAMFLLPPIPGVPVYLAMGIVIVAIGRETMGITWSIVYGIALSLGLKLVACAVQQKVIGENLKRYVYVRQQCMINSRLIRASKLILQQPGMPVSKVCILVGGPDWPTSVLCGIMGLDLIPILVGTLPVIVIIVPTLMTASFTYMQSLETDGPDKKEEFPWAETAVAVSAAVTAVVQVGAMLFATKYIEHTLKTRGDEIDALPVDREVEEADTRAKIQADAYHEASKWSVLPPLAKVALTVSVVVIVGSTYCVLLFQGLCFVEYELTSTISEDLDGNALNLVQPLGWVAIGLSALSCCLLLSFMAWAKRRASHSTAMDPPLEMPA